MDLYNWHGESLYIYIMCILVNTGTNISKLVAPKLNWAPKESVVIYLFGKSIYFKRNDS